MAIERVLNYVVEADGTVTCNGTRRPQLAGVQGDDGICTLNFNLSAVWNDKSHYFFEIVLGERTPLLLSDESDGVSLNEKTLSLVLNKEFTGEGGRVEISIVEEILDEENAEAIEGSTYTTYIKLEAKDGVIRRIRETAYGIFLDCKKLLTEALSAFNTATVLAEEARHDYEEVAGDIQENKANVSIIYGNLSGHSRSIEEHSEQLDTLENRANEHEVSAEAHNDIRLFIKELQTKVNTLLDSDDTTLDQMSEIVAYIKANKELIESVTTAKVNVDDIIDNLTTNVSNKPLSAAQGVALKSLIDNIKMPTKLSELNDDVGYATKEELINKTNIPFNISIYRNGQYGFEVSWYILQGDGTIAHPIESIDLSNHISNSSLISGVIYLVVNKNNEWHAAIEPSVTGKYIECFSWYYDIDLYNQFAVYPIAFDYFYNAEFSCMISEINNLKDRKANKANTKNILDSVLETNSEYYLGDVSADTALSFPSTAEIGDTIYINFNCASQFALTIDMTNTSDIDIDIEEGVSYEIFATFNGAIWILGYNEYTVS